MIQSHVLSRSRRAWLGRGVGITVSAIATGLLSPLAVSAQISSAGAATPASDRPLSDLGIELVTVRLTAEAFMIDLRYRIVDGSKAKPFVNQNVRPVLVNETTGDRYYVPNAPKIGPLRQTATPAHPIQQGKVYFMMFANPNRRLHAGEKVTLYAGDSVVRNLVVR